MSDSKNNNNNKTNDIDIEDDEFEEFPIDTWTAKEADASVTQQMWGDNWDDDDIEEGKYYENEV